VLAAPFVFLLHDLEEIFLVGPWARDHAASLPALVREMVPATGAPLVAPIAVILAVSLAVAVAAARSPRRGTWTTLFLLIVAGRHTNVVTHVVQTAVCGGYVPGLATALLVVAPFGAWLWRRALAEGWIERRRSVPLLLAGFPLQGAALLLVLAARELAP
jgi:hypothetical protein